MDILGQVKKILSNRDAKLKKLASLKESRQAKLQPLKQKLVDEENKLREHKKFLAGDFIRAAQKNLARVATPIDAEILELSKELASNPPAAVIAFTEECARKIGQLRDAKEQAPNVLRSSRTGDPLEATRYDGDAIDRVIEVLQQQVRDAGRLVTEALTEAELTKQIETLRSQPLPEIKTLRFARDSSHDEFQQVTA